MSDSLSLARLVCMVPVIYSLEVYEKYFKQKKIRRHCLACNRGMKATPGGLRCEHCETEAQVRQFMRELDVWWANPEEVVHE